MTSDLPPLPPLPPLPLGQLDYATPQAGRSDLRAIAVRQRAIMYCILWNFVMIALQIALPVPLSFFAAFGLIAGSLAAAIFAFLLAMAIYSTGTGIVMGILTLFPYLGLIFLLIINAKATSILRAHQIHVGLMGARLSQIPDPGQIQV